VRRVAHRRGSRRPDEAGQRRLHHRLATSKEEFTKFGTEANTRTQSVGANWGWLGKFIQDQANGSGAGLLDLTKKFAMLGATPQAGSLVAGGAMAILPSPRPPSRQAPGRQRPGRRELHRAGRTHQDPDDRGRPVAGPGGRAKTAKQLGAAFQQINPEIKQAFTALGPEIQPLVAGIAGLVSGMMPGLVAGLQSAMPIVQALSSGLSSLGQGLGGFFTALTDGADGAASGLSSILNMLGDFLPCWARSSPPSRRSAGRCCRP